MIKQGNTVFPNAAAEFVYIRTYARWIEEEKRRETWEETVDRYIDYMEKHCGDKVPHKVFRKCRENILNMRVMPSMRAMWSAGKAADSTHVSMYNCSFLVVDSIEAFAECLYILCCGTGVGFSVEKKYIDKLPIVPKLTSDGTGTFQVPDSKVGWADSVKFLMQSLYSGKDLDIDYSLIRPKGSRLRTFGGRASGPAPLINLHTFIRSSFEEAQGRKLKPIECLDIMNRIAEIVVCGGVRRSSQISFSDLDDEEIAGAKNYPFPLHRSMSNNSVIYHEKPGAVRFIEEWALLAKSGTGERGIFNIEGVKKRCPKRRNRDKVLGSNPCFSPETLIKTNKGLFRADNLVGRQSKVWDGTQYIDTEFKVTSKNEKMLRIILHDNSYIRVTPYHTVILENGERKHASDLKIGEKLAVADSRCNGDVNCRGTYIKGFLVGDGTTNGKVPMLYVYKPKYVCLDRLVKSALEVKIGNVNTNAISDVSFCDDGINRKRFRGLSVRKEELMPWCTIYKRSLPVEIFEWNIESKLQFIAGVMDADGTASDTKNGFMYQISSVHYRWLLDFQMLLKTIGVNSCLRLSREKGQVDFNDGYGEYNTKDCYRLTISQVGAKLLSQQVKFDRLISFANKDIKYHNRHRFNKIVDILDDGVEKEVFCCTVNTNHSLSLGVGVQIGQCAEIVLRDKQFCNLSEVIIKNGDDLDDVLDKIESAIWLGAMQSTFVKFPYLRKSWRANCVAEHLLGVSLTGQMDNIELLTKDALIAMKKKALKVCEKACKILGINMSAAITCVKPSGTVSQVVNSSSGLHPRFSKYYIRRYRIASIDPLYKMLKEQGIPMDPEVGQREKDWKKAQSGDVGSCTIYEKGKRWSEDKVNTWIISFPIKSPEKSIVKEEMTAIQQLEHYKKIQQYWCEHNASMTCYTDENSWLEVGNWVYQNWKYISGVSFLPADGGHYESAPYQSISKEEYEKMIKELPKIDYSQLSKYEQEDNTTGAKEIACGGGKCEI